MTPKAGENGPLGLQLPGWSVPKRSSATMIRRYSTTGDVLSFKRCRRQYGYFGVRGFSSATNTQRYFGTLVHDVLDQVHREYTASKSLPDEAAIELLVGLAHNRLVRTGVRPFNPAAQRGTAIKLIYRFVTLVGHSFFPHVRHTEYRLERVLKPPTGKEYILDGVVDVLAGAVSHDLGLPFATAPGDIEIWDFKSGDMPAKSDPILRDYEYQMRVYAELYRQQTGGLPARCALAFLGQLDDDRVWNEGNSDVANFPGLIYVIHPNPTEIAEAVNDFHGTVAEIEKERLKPYVEQWQPPEHPVDTKTCEACDIRFSCATFPPASRQLAVPL